MIPDNLKQALGFEPPLLDVSGEDQGSNEMRCRMQALFWGRIRAGNDWALKQQPMIEGVSRAPK